MTVLHLDLPDDLHARVKSAAALKRMSLKDWVTAVLEEAVTNGPRGLRNAARPHLRNRPPVHPPMQGAA